MLAESVKSKSLNEICNSVSKAPEISKFAGSPIWCHKGLFSNKSFSFLFFLIPKTPMWRKIPIRSVWLPAAEVTHHLTSCKPAVRAARGAAALPSQFPVFLLQMHLEILLLLYIITGLLKKNKLSSTFLLSMHLRLAMGLHQQTLILAIDVAKICR